MPSSHSMYHCHLDSVSHLDPLNYPLTNANKNTITVKDSSSWCQVVYAGIRMTWYDRCTMPCVCILSSIFVRMRRLCLVSLQRKWRVTFALEGASQSKPIPFQDDQGYSPPDCWAAKFADYVPNSAMLGVSKCNISGKTKMNQTASHINRTYFDVFARSLQRGFILDKGMCFRMIA